MIKRIALTLSIIATMLITLSSGASAFNGLRNVCSQDQDASNSTICSQGNSDTVTNPILGPSGILTDVIRIISIIVGIAAVLMIVVGGLQYITSGGNPEKTNRAKDTILFAIIGVVVAAVAQAIVIFVLSKIS